MATALEPCPFCRSNHLHLAHSGLDYCVVCQSCKSKGPHQETLERAINRWNETSVRLGVQPLPETATSESLADRTQPEPRYFVARG
ncbi:Lar family restriction alleviation protein [Marinimicrobium sp. LS-A18]|uniref:Lar family restriction alleviation protein n=1 Tax=Marinimicrobium sp. LS-A18 TaxID=1381596 RepID=UPI000463D772